MSHFEKIKRKNNDKDKDIETSDLIVLSDVVNKLVVLHSRILDSKSDATELMKNLNSKFSSYEIRSNEVEMVLTEALAYLSDFEEQFETMEDQVQPLISMLKKMDQDSGGIRGRIAKKPPFIDFYKFDSFGKCIRRFQPVGNAVLMYKCFLKTLSGYKVGMIDNSFVRTHLKKFATFCSQHTIHPSPKYCINAIDLDNGNKLKVIEIPKTAYFQLQTICSINGAIFGDMDKGIECTVTRTGKNLNTKYTASGKKRILSNKEKGYIKKYGLYDIKKSCFPAQNEKELKKQLGI